MTFRTKYDANQTLVLNKNSKPFTWSYSRLKNYETCPRRYKGIDVDKEFKQDETEQLNEGDRLHKAMAKRINSDIALPPEFYYMERHATALAQHTHDFQIVNCELKLAISRNYEAAGFFDRNVWARCVIDYIKLVPQNPRPPEGEKLRKFAHIVDYKTGKLIEDDAQLAVMAMVVFSIFKDVVGIKAEFLWTKYNDTRSIIFTRKSIQEYWPAILERVQELEQAHIEDNFPPTPCKLCKEYCAIETCEHWGKSQ